MRVGSGRGERAGARSANLCRAAREKSSGCVRGRGLPGSARGRSSEQRGGRPGAGEGGDRGSSADSDVGLGSEGERARAKAKMVTTRRTAAKLRNGTPEAEDMEKAVPRLTKQRSGEKSILKAFGLDLDGIPKADLAAIVSVYFVQGSLNLSRLAVTFFLKDDLQLPPAEVSMVQASSFIPWMIKPLYGFCSDAIPIFGYKRRSYLALCGFLGCFSYLMFASAVRNPASAVACIVASSVGTACSDVVVDSVVVERSRDQRTAGSLQSLCWSAYAFGAILSTFFSGTLVSSLGVRPVFLLTATLPLITTATSFVIDEDKSVGKGKLAEIPSQMRGQATRLWRAVRDPAILYPSAFIFLVQATPQPEGALFFFKTEKLGFDAEFMGRVNFISRVAMLIGVGVYNNYLKDVPLRRIFKWVIVTGTLISASQLMLITGANKGLGVSDEVFAVGDSALLTVLGQLSFMPLLVLAAQICPEGIEATLFATLMSILNSGSYVGISLGALLTKAMGVDENNFDNMVPLVVTCTLMSVAPLLLLRLVPENITSRDD